jgi:hypothetical protein
MSIASILSELCCFSWFLAAHVWLVPYDLGSFKNRSQFELHNFYGVFAFFRAR